MTKKELEIIQEKRAEYLKLATEAIREPEKYKYTYEEYSAMYDALSDITIELLTTTQR